MFSASRTSLTSETSSNPQSSSSSLENGVPSNSEVVTPPSPSSPLSLSSLLDSNPLFSAGFGLMIFGSVLALSRKGLTLAASTAQRRLLISLEIPSKDKSHPWFLHWMGEQAKAQSMRQAGLLGGVKRESFSEFLGMTKVKEAAGAGVGSLDKEIPNPLTSRDGYNVSPVRIRSHDLSVETSYVGKDANGTGNGNGFDEIGERAEARFTLVPGPGTHWFRYRGVWMRLQREKNTRMVDIRSGAPLETITLTTLYSFSHLFPQLLSEARQLALSATEGKTSIFTAWGTEWRPFGKPRRTRELGSVILGGDQKERIKEDLEMFMKRGRWYSERGIPYRRGYLLHGSPGSGKSSFITALAGSFDFNICLLNLSERGLTDDKLNHLMSSLPSRSILLLEDIDAAFSGRKQVDGGGGMASDGYQSSVTFSGLLNALDGVASGEKRITFMTTNHVEKLDGALIRPGRVDIIAELGDAMKDQVRELVVNFYGDRDEKSNLGERKDVSGIQRKEEGKVLESSITTPISQIELERIASTFAETVIKTSLNRRLNLGLDPTGRYSLSDPSSSLTTSTASTSTPSTSASISNSSTPSPPPFSSSPRPSNPQTVSQTSAAAPKPAARGGVSMAELQGLFIRFPGDVREAVRAFEEEN